MYCCRSVKLEEDVEDLKHQAQQNETESMQAVQQLDTLQSKVCQIHNNWFFFKVFTGYLMHLVRTLALYILY